MLGSPSAPSVLFWPFRFLKEAAATEAASIGDQGPACLGAQEAPGVARTWRLEVDASHFHRVLGVMGSEVSVVEQAFGAGLRVLAFTREETDSQSQHPGCVCTSGTGTRGLQTVWGLQTQRRE